VTGPNPNGTRGPDSGHPDAAPDRNGSRPARRRTTVAVMALDPQSKALLDFMATLGLPRPESLRPAEVRTMMAAGRATRPPGPRVRRVEDVTVGGANGPLPARVYAPSTRTGLPVIVYFHGGG
jgi:acetyl esterase/lipase